MYKTVSIIVASLLFSSCANSPATRGNGDSSLYATRDVEIVMGDMQTYLRIALVIGNNNYQKHKKLTNAVPDARAMRDFLTKKHFKVVYAENATQDVIKSKINEFLDGLGKQSIAFVYYAGHATQDKSRKTKETTNYLLPINDTTLDKYITDYDKDAISFNDILNKIDEKNHGLNIAMLDACRTPIGRGGAIENIGAEGVYLVYSTASGVTASDSGAFRRSFLKYAEQPLKLTDIFGKVKLDLRKEGQRPSIQNDIVGTFYFTQAIKPTPTPKTKGKWNPLIYRGKRSYSKNSTNTVKDNYTGLIWQKEDDGVKRNWKDAKRYCSNLSLDGSSDWRLPTMEELCYLGDMTKVKPAIDSNYFDIENSYYWSATAYKNDSSIAWGVNFKDGGDGWGNESDKNLALCVR